MLGRNETRLNLNADFISIQVRLLGKNKSVAVINNVVLSKHWQISRRNISNGVLEAKRLR